VGTATLGTLRPVSTPEYLSLSLGEHGTVAAGNPNFVRTGGKYVAQPTAATANADVIDWKDERGYSIPHIGPISVVTVTTGASASTATGTIGGVAAFGNLTITSDVSLATGAVATLNLLIDSDLGASGTWWNIAQSTIYTATGKFALQLTGPQGTAVESTLTSDAGAGTYRQVQWANNLRIRAVVSGTATTSVSAIIYVSAVA
jgi:hypothetical protein